MRLVYWFPGRPSLPNMMTLPAGLRPSYSWARPPKFFLRKLRALRLNLLHPPSPPFCCSVTV